MLNINHFLGNSARCDVIGTNIYTMGRDTECFRLPEERKLGYIPASNWDAPSFGLQGHIAIGHQLDIGNLLTLSISENGKELSFDAVRNYWTPSYMQTVYRSKTDAEVYPFAGCLAVSEQKCFLPDDTFFSKVKLCNDNREDCTFTISLKLPLVREDEGKYILDAKTAPKSLKRTYSVKGYVAACNNDGKDCFTITVPACNEVEFSYGLAFDTADFDTALNRLQAAFSVAEPLKVKEEYFNNWMAENIPHLESDNIDILKIYYYRSFLVYRNIHTPDKYINDHDFKGECVYECPFGSWFGAPVGLSIPLQIEEMKWFRNPRAVFSHIKNWLRGVGSTAGYIQATPWAIWRLYNHHPDKEFLRLCYETCRAFTLKTYSLDNPQQLPKQIGSWNTGAEYQPAFYQYTTPAWDWRYDHEGARDYGFKKALLYRVDDCSILAANLKACAEMAQILGNEEDAVQFENCFKTVRQQIIKLFWNEKEQFFFDCEPNGLKQCDLAGEYDGFAPMMWDIIGEGFDAAFDRLSDVKHFKTDFPAPTVSKSCPMYWFDNCIAGPTASSVKEPKTYGCCWNGPAWPFANTIILESLGSAAKRNSALKESFLQFFKKYTELHFLYSDRSVPAIVESYRPTDGVTFSQHNEYFHSEWISLFMEYYAGITVSGDTVTFAPLTKEEFTLRNVAIRGKNYTFKQYIEQGILKQRIEKI